MVKLVETKAIKQILFHSMIDAIKSCKRAELESKKKAWRQAMNNIKTAAHFSDIITLEKIKNKL